MTIDPEFCQVIEQIYRQHKNQTILTQAMGIDCISFAHEIIAAWEQHCRKDANSDRTDGALIDVINPITSLHQ